MASTPWGSSRDRKLSRHMPPQLHRRGAVIVLVAILMVAMFAMLAVSIDIGYVASCRTELDRANDAGALAGAAMIADGAGAADAAARQFVKANLVGARQVEDSEITVELGEWDPDARVFTPGGSLPTAVRVTTVRNDQPHYFARVLGHNAFDLTSQSVAMYQPLDIMLVLDYSGSMNDDSELKKIGAMGQPAVESNLYDIWLELGSPTAGNMQWQPQFISSTNNTTIKQTLDLADAAGNEIVPYPYPVGSWDGFVNYVKSNQYVEAAGYDQSYGYLTFINYVLERRPMAQQTPNLWQTSEQPLTAVKDGVQVYLATLQAADTEDHVGFVAYTAGDGTAKLEHELTPDFETIETLSRQRQAAHYDRYTNIGAGLEKAIAELRDRARPGSFKLIILMTDGIANRPTDTTVGRQFALDQAAIAAAEEFPVLTISLGSGADTALMQSIADMTLGKHFNVPGGQAVAEYEDQLKDVFRSIAAERPLKLVQVGLQ